MHRNKKQYRKINTGSIYAVKRGDGWPTWAGFERRQFFSYGVMKRRRRIAVFTSKLKMQMLKGASDK